MLAYGNKFELLRWKTIARRGVTGESGCGSELNPYRYPCDFASEKLELNKSQSFGLRHNNTTLSPRARTPILSPITPVASPSLHGPSMARSRGTCLFQEARLNIEPAFPGSTISVTLPSRETSTFGTRSYPKRTVVTDEPTDRSEHAFAKRHLASDGALYFRKHHQYPRSFLWRLLDDRKVLEIQAADLDHDQSHPCEANLTFLLHFSSPVRPFCIAFAEPEDRDSLTIFAITTANDFYTISLHRDFFIRLSASEQKITDWAKLGLVNQFTLRTPYRMVAQSNNELLVTLDNGGILHLTRNGRDDIVWNESVYQESGWSMRDMIRWKSEQKVRFGDDDLSMSAAAAVALSPDQKHILSVCLNYKLRAWNLASGRLGVHADLLGDPEIGTQKTQYCIGASQKNLMAVVNIPGGPEGGAYHIVTYSPKQHQFRFWGVRDADEPENGVYEVRSDFEFVPPIDELMNTTAWTLEEFFVVPGSTGWRGAELWIRARSGPSSQVFSLAFDLNAEVTKLASKWKNNWRSVDPGPLSVEQLKQNPANPGEHESDDSDPFAVDVSEKWQDFLFYPGRFTQATLEAALLVFRRGLPQGTTPQAAVKGTLKERICAVVAAFAAIGQQDTQSHQQYQEALSAHWQAFYSLVKDLHKRRGQHLSLSYDHHIGMPWLVLSDYLSGVRLSSKLEFIHLNSDILGSSSAMSTSAARIFGGEEDRAVARLVNAAALFRGSLPSSVRSQLLAEVEDEVLGGRSVSVMGRMETMEANCNLIYEVTDDDVNAFVEVLGMSAEDLTTEIFTHAMALLGPNGEGRVVEDRQVARFGLNALVRVSQETIALSKSVLLDLLVLAIYLTIEEGTQMENFDGPEIFVQIINQLKDMAVLEWMASTVWSTPAPTSPSSRTLLEGLAKTYKTGGRLPVQQTVLEGILGHSAFSVRLPKALGSELLTYWSRIWLAQEYNDRTFDAYLEDIMTILLIQKEYGLAIDYSKFLSESNWSTYLKGRMHLALGENDLAAISYKRASYNLGKMRLFMPAWPLLMLTALGEFDINAADSMGLIPAEQRNSFTAGLPRYYDHVLGLFEKVKAYPYVAEFARLGLRTLRAKTDDELRTDLLSRLFNASIQIAQFDDAYSAVIRHTNAALYVSVLQAPLPFESLLKYPFSRTAALTTLATTMISQHQTTHLLSYPFVGLAPIFDAILAQLAAKTLTITPSKGPQYHLILASFRTQRNDYRGAATILYDRLQRLQSSGEQRADPQDTSIVDTYLMIINTLSCVREEDAWILAEGGGALAGSMGIGLGMPNLSLSGGNAKDSANGNMSGIGKLDWGIGKARKVLKRRVITLEGLRKEYQAELDRVEAIEKGAFPFVEAGDEMDIL